MKVHSFTLGEFQENCYVVEDETTGKAAVIDPGGEGDRLVGAIERLGLDVHAIWLTHAHLDHIGAVGAVKERWPVPAYLHPADMRLYMAAERQAVMYGLHYDQPPAPDRELSDGQRLELGSLTFDVFHAPGHAPGHVVIHGHGVAFVGDCLFAGSIGRTDLPGSNGPELEESLARIASLAPDTIVYAGHGPATTIGEELATNPFLNGMARIPR